MQVTEIYQDRMEVEKRLSVWKEERKGIYGMGLRVYLGNRLRNVNALSATKL